MLTSSIVFISVLLTSVTAQDDSRIAGCTSQAVQTYIAALPNAEACDMAFNNVITPDNLTASLQTFCSVDCGGSIVELTVTNCRNLELSALLHLFCLPRETGGDYYCRSVFPDLLDNGDSLITDLTSCSNFSECPAQCTNALMMVVNRLGCCYQNIYNNTDLIDEFVREQLLSAEEGQILRVIAEDSLWEACNVNLTTPCTGDPFPGMTQLGIGVCTADQENSFFFNLGQNCLNSLIEGFTTVNPPESVFDNGVCIPECGGQLASFYEQTCLDQYAALSSDTNCFRSDGEIGSRCFYSNPIAGGAAVARADFFTEARTTCFADPTANIAGPCPSGCMEALQEVKVQLGCCYQDIYNNTLTLDSLYVLDVITPEERNFFISLGTKELWQSCEVSLQPQCIGDPYAAATTPATTPSSALQVAASILMMTCMVGISFMHLY